MKLTQKKIKEKNNPIAKMLKDPQFKQKKKANKKFYNRKKDNARLLKEAI